VGQPPDRSGNLSVRSLSTSATAVSAAATAAAAAREHRGFSLAIVAAREAGSRRTAVPAGTRLRRNGALGPPLAARVAPPDRGG
jgi:hypothetical protein